MIVVAWVVSRPSAAHTASKTPHEGFLLAGHDERRPKLLEGTARAAEELLLGVAVLMIDRVAVLAAATQREASHAAWRRFERPRVNGAVQVRPFEVRGASLARCRWTRQQKGLKKGV